MLGRRALPVGRLGRLGATLHVHRGLLAMSERKAFLLRIDPEVLDAVQRWANDDLRSLNAQIEFVLRKVLKQEGRLGERGVDRSARERGKA
jgi:hypothetical protein